MAGCRAGYGCFFRRLVRLHLWRQRTASQKGTGLHECRHVFQHLCLRDIRLDGQSHAGMNSHRNLSEFVDCKE